MNSYFVVLMTICSMMLTASYGAVLDFRSGTITAAEITSAPIKIHNLDPDAFPNLPEQKLFAILSIKLSPNRKITIFDYSLESRGSTYPCVAVNTDRSFKSSEKDFAGDSIQLLFIIEARNMPQWENITLKCNLPPTDGTYDITVPFKYLGYKSPAGLQRIPEIGLLEKH